MKTAKMLATLGMVAASLALAPAGAAQDGPTPACTPGAFALDPGSSAALSLEGWIGLGIRAGVGGTSVSNVLGKPAPDDGSLIVGKAVYSDGRASLPLTATAAAEGRSYTLTINYTLTTVTWAKKEKQVTEKPLTCVAVVVVRLLPLAIPTWAPEGTATAVLKGNAVVKKVSPKALPHSRQTHTADAPQIHVLGTEAGVDTYSVKYRIGGWTGETRLVVTVVDRKSQYLELEVTVVKGQTADVRLPGPPDWSVVKYIQVPPAPTIAELLVFGGTPPASDVVKVKGVEAGTTEALLLYKRRQAPGAKEEHVLVKLLIKVVAPPEQPRQADQPPPKR